MSGASRIRRTAVLAAAAALTLSACGGSGGDGGKNDDAPKAKGPNLKGQTVSVAAVWSGPEKDAFRKVLDAFEEATGAKVTLVPAQDPIIGFLESKVASGGQPDVAMLPQVGAIEQAVANGWAKPLGKGAEEALKTNYSKGWADLGSVDGTPYGVYFKAANKSLVWYNTAVFENAGVEEPKTWDEFLKAAQTVFDSGVTPVSVAGADGWTLTDWFENVYLSQAGPEKYDQLAKHEIKWTDASVTKALETLADLFGNKDFLAGARAARSRRSSRPRSRRPSPAVTSRRPAWSSRATSSPSTSARPTPRSAPTPRSSRSRRSARTRPPWWAVTRPWR
ncbi:ABC transporter substrate-binding protein [Actinomadura keratinilytica]